ncbi:hypothetical protein GIB67_037552 [Kingdonia uniflora]|uniref:NAC domain-containing protein n=1 Tax=Kingdonia uniflora TaxID=39325 RepID=A0A7J7NB69_9MAGN|nr:hypothetical protein GIB67_037552 [Kingdonia uniflora]
MPLGYIFSPTDERLFKYLSLKINGKSPKYNPIFDVDVYNCDPEYLPRMIEDGELKAESYYYVRRKRLSKNSSRPNRLVGELGYWHSSTHTDFEDNNGVVTSTKMQLVFYRYKDNNVAGKKVAEKTDWIMHEFSYIPDKSICKFIELAIVRIRYNERKRKQGSADNQSNSNGKRLKISALGVEEAAQQPQQLHYFDCVPNINQEIVNYDTFQEEVQQQQEESDLGVGGYIFSPTDDHLFKYLSLKINGKSPKYNPIIDVDVYNCDPEYLPSMYLYTSYTLKLWMIEAGELKAESYYYVRRKRLSKNSSRPNRLMQLVFYRYKDNNVAGKKVAEKTDWIMHEFSYIPDKSICKFIELAIVRIRYNERKRKQGSADNQSNSNGKRLKISALGVEEAAQQPQQLQHFDCVPNISQENVNYDTFQEEVQQQEKESDLGVGEAAQQPQQLQHFDYVSNISQENANYDTFQEEVQQHEEQLEELTTNVSEDYEQEQPTNGLVYFDMSQEEMEQQQQYPYYYPTSGEEMVNYNPTQEEAQIQQLLSDIPLFDDGAWMVEEQQHTNWLEDYFIPS